MTNLEKILHQRASSIRRMYVGAGVAFALAAALLTGLAIYLSPSALSAFLPKKVISTGKHGNSPLATSSTEMTLDPNDTMTTESTNSSQSDNTTSTANTTIVLQWYPPIGCRECTKNSLGQLLASVNLRSGQIQTTQLGDTLVNMTAMVDETPDNQTTCDVRALLNITVPEGSVIRFDLVHEGSRTGSRSATFDIADSQHADGLSYKCEYHSSTSGMDPSGFNLYSDDCAEMSSINNGDASNSITFYGTFLPNWWSYTEKDPYVYNSNNRPNLVLNDFTDVIKPKMTFWAGHQYMAGTNYDTTMNFCMDNDMVFLPEQPSKSPNNNIYFGMNRIISNAFVRYSSGLCEAYVYLLESCMK